MKCHNIIIFNNIIYCHEIFAILKSISGCFIQVFDSLSISFNCSLNHLFVSNVNVQRVLVSIAVPIMALW